MKILARHGEAAITLGGYAIDPTFISSVFENWESEFLQMSAYVVLTAILIQKGSAESQRSRRAAARRRSRDAGAQAGRAADPEGRRRRALALCPFARPRALPALPRSPSSFTGWQQRRAGRGRRRCSMARRRRRPIAYLGDPQLWFESFQNWQSEFLSTAVLVVLSIFLRQRRIARIRRPSPRRTRRPEPDLHGPPTVYYFDKTATPLLQTARGPISLDSQPPLSLLGQVRKRRKRDDPQS